MGNERGVSRIFYPSIFLQLFSFRKHFLRNAELTAISSQQSAFELIASTIGLS